ncbi:MULTISPECIES: IPT/TIG domain-containing protein [unclassified Streptomyces]|uniref:IPT/TIG domain-containing protein n=1 Tax=unclassified Streptomyces TaxID=2593676 RepID=UPI002365FBAE|nr:MULTISPECIES: IPT/TIG domain-containing protein [unclassified Streptomyces]MDF3142664.1 IPT/TIG domain-containing protein [Streptomyces sp. T21Q-yed]WDF39198.1 IPT/TIG domain-containing protein [Streptomyces sp. T12]
MSDDDSCPAARRGRAAKFAAVFAAVVSLFASTLTLAGASPAVAVEAECAPLALASFGDPAGAVGKATVPAQDSACFSVTAPQAGLYRMLLDDSGNNAYAQMYAEDGSQVDCYDEQFSDDGWCQVPAAGTYTVKVVNNGWADPEEAEVTVVPLGSATQGCFEPVGTSWDLPTVSRTSASRLEVDCQAFEGKPGERVRLTRGTSVYGFVVAWITDASGARICPRITEDDEDTFSCVLPGEGPYRVLSQVTEAGNGFPAEYAVKVRALTDPQGCRTAPVRPFGPPQGLDFDSDPCFTFTVDKAGSYLVHAVDDDSANPVQVYDAAGKIACRTGDPCRLPAAGTYTATLDGTSPYSGAHDDLLVLDRASDAGCVPTGMGLYKGELSTAGQYDCLTLDAPQGARIAALTSLSSAGLTPEVEVLDRAGTPQCDEDELKGGDCALTGEAPYRALVHTDDEGDSATGAYAVAFHRTDVAQGCPVLPAGSFAADGAKATLTTGDGVFSRCLGIPADAHTDAEVFQLIATSGTSSAEFSVLDSDGKRVCERWATTNGWTICSLTPGKAHTVLVTGRDQAATYTLTRRDVTASASSAGCTKTAAAKVGGPSVKSAYGAPGTLDCRQVTTAADTDVVHVNVRDALGTANSAVVAGDGRMECSFRNTSCAVTGSTTHQVLVQTPANLRAAPEYRLDALRIATADGPAPECVKVPSVAYGYGPITGTLDESRTAVCAALPTAGFDRFETDIKDTAGATTTAVPVLYNTSTWANGCTHYIPEGYDCDALGSSPQSTPTLFLLGLPEKAPSTAYSAKLTCTSAPCGTEETAVTAVSPDTGAAGGKVKLTVTGTALGPDVTVRLSQAGKTITAAADSVSADNRTVTATLDLTGAATGTWNVSVITRGWEFGRGTFTVTPQPKLENTAAPKVTGTAKTGAKVTAAPGSWSATPSSYTYQWKANGTAISGATASTYTVPASMVGKKLTVTVTAVKSGWVSGSATSAAVTVAKGDAPKATTLPVISGTAKVGRTLKTSKGAWSPAATSYAYQWYANGRAISGATKSSLVLKSAQKGKKITVKVIAHRTGHQDGAAVSNATKTVAG